MADPCKAIDACSRLEVGYCAERRANLVMFTWKPLYKEIAVKVLTYEDRQGELVALLEKLKQQGLGIMPLTDYQEEKQVELTEIDPFTFFAVFNRPITDEKRRAILSALKKEWDLKSPDPSDFAGIPLANNQNSWFFAYASDRDSGDVPKLWRLAKEAFTTTATSFNRHTLSDALAVRQVGLAKATVGMFWLNPDEFIGTDQYSREFFAAHGIKLESENVDGYFAWVEKIRNRLGSDFAMLSHQAYGKAAADEVERPRDPAEHRLWTLSAGHGGEYWSDFEKNGLIAIGWDDLGDLEHFESKDKLHEEFKRVYQEDGSNQNVLACWQFTREIQPGDIIYVKQGRRKLFAIAKVTGGYKFETKRPDCPFVRLHPIPLDTAKYRLIPV